MYIILTWSCMLIFMSTVVAILNNRKWVYPESLSAIYQPSETIINVSMVTGRATLTLDLIRYDANDVGCDNCCFGATKCDPEFIICLEQLSVGKRECASKFQKDNTYSIDFTRENPHTFPFHLDSLRNELKLTINIADFDVSSNEPMDSLSKSLGSDFATDSPQQVTLSGGNIYGIKIQAVYSISCDVNYYGQVCDVYCNNNSISHSCDATGQPVCREGFLKNTSGSCDLTTTTTTTTALPTTMIKPTITTTSTTHTTATAKTAATKPTTPTATHQTTPTTISTFKPKTPPPTKKTTTNKLTAELEAFMQQERAMLTKLGSRIAALRAQTEGLNKTIVPCGCQLTTSKPSPVAFTGTLQQYQTGLTAITWYNFSGDLTNIGQPFNVTSGRFVAKVPGLYGFSVVIYMTHGYWLAMELVKNDLTPVLLVRTGHLQTSKINTHNNMGTNFAVAYLDAGDEVWIKYVDSSNATLYADGVTTFSGVLLHPM